ncbi:MAG: hypothetical protein KDA42_02010 [Planctomycetales bacterium]|nr:hypothetical protein [Planctomycetales bacterium]
MASVVGKEVDTSHTPGPWFAWKTEVEGKKAWVVTTVPEDDWTPQHRVIATIYGNDAISQGNAEIIAKAASSAKALVAAKKMMTDPKNATREDKKIVMNLDEILADSNTVSARVAAQSSAHQKAVMPLWRIFTVFCVLWTIGWVIWGTGRLVVKGFEIDEPTSKTQMK